MRWGAAGMILLLWLCAEGCGESSPTDIPLAPEFATPVATGIYLASAESPELLGVWGRPADHVPSSSSAGALPAAFAISFLYPNPSDGATVLLFALPSASVVAIWIVPARGPGQEPADFTMAWGALLPSPQRVPIAYPLPLSTLSAGVYQLTWNGRDGAGDPVPSGYYRFYVRFNEDIYWRDMFLYRDLAAIPAGMRTIR